MRPAVWRFGVSMALLFAAGCPTREAVNTHIDEVRARAAVLKSYRQLFQNTYARDARTGEYERYPLLDLADLKYAEFRGDAWLVRADPPSGFIVHARVGKDGDWVEFTWVGFNDW
jgi:hypothetical protein